MTLPFTKSSEIAEYLTSLLSGITVATGYNTDIGLRVFRGKRSKVEEQVPCAIIIEGEDHPGESAGREAIKITQDYVVGGYVECDPDNPNDAAHLVIKDIKRVLFNQGPRMGGRVANITYAGRDIGPRSDGAAIVFAVVHVSVTFAETLADA